MEVSEAIALAREKAESMSRLARVLSRLKPTIYATGVTTRLCDDGELTFYCATEEVARKLAAMLPVKLDLAYRAASTTLHGSTLVQGVVYRFEVPTIRKIRLSECVLKRSRKRQSGWASAALLFNGLELTNVDYCEKLSSNQLKEMLWSMAIRSKRERSRLERFDFVL